MALILHNNKITAPVNITYKAHVKTSSLGHGYQVSFQEGSGARFANIQLLIAPLTLTERQELEVQLQVFGLSTIFQVDIHPQGLVKNVRLKNSSYSFRSIGRNHFAVSLTVIEDII